MFFDYNSNNSRSSNQAFEIKYYTEGAVCSRKFVKNKNRESQVAIGELMEILHAWVTFQYEPLHNVNRKNTNSNTYWHILRSIHVT